MARKLIVVSALHACLGNSSLLDGANDEATVLGAVQSADLTSIDAEDIAVLVRRGWFKAATKIVSESHQRGTAETRAQLATVVRRETEALKKNCDSLVQGLTVQKQVGHVSCAFQWAQNSSCIFLSVKFSHRWSSPGALERTNQVVNITNESFSVSADGEHSGLRKHYGLDIKFHDAVDAKYATWVNAAAGRMTALIPKMLPARWPQLNRGKDKLKNMAVWPEMNEKWSDELKLFKAVSRSFVGGKSKTKGGEIPAYHLDRRDFKFIDANGDNLASKYEMCEFAKYVTPLLFPDKDSFPFIRSWDKDSDGSINATEWQGKGSLAESKLGITRQILLAQVDASDTDRDGLVSFEDLLAAGFADNSDPASSKSTTDTAEAAKAGDATSSGADADASQKAEQPESDTR